MAVKKQTRKVFLGLLIAILLLTSASFARSESLPNSFSTSTTLARGVAANSIDDDNSIRFSKDFSVQGTSHVYTLFGWMPVGTPAFSAGRASFTSLAFDNGTPYVAYSDNGNGGKATVMKFNGSSWETVGTAGFSAGSAWYTSIAIDGGMPYIAYEDYYYSGKATVMRYNGSNWEPVGTPGFSAGSASYISFAMDGSMPYVAYQDNGNGGKATVMKFNGSNWETVGAPGFSAGRVNHTSLAFDGGIPYVAYEDWGYNGKATVMKFNGSNWEVVGMPGFSAGNASFTSLAFDNGTPYVAYQDNSNHGKATVMKFNGSNWEPVGTPCFSARSAWDISFAIDGGMPYIAYEDGGGQDIQQKGTLMRFNGSSWETVGKTYFSAGKVYDTSLAFDGGIPYVAYQDSGYNGKATVMKYDAYPTYSVSFSSTAANDGWTLESSEYSSRANTRDNSGPLLVGDDAKNKQYRSLLYFDTSSLPDNATVANATLKIKLADVSSGTDPFTTHFALLADMAKGFFGKSSALENIDFQAKGVPRFNMGSFAPVNGEPGWYGLDLNPANYKYVNLKGVTQFRIRFAKDDNNNKVADFISFYSGDDVTNPPQLIVECITP